MSFNSSATTSATDVRLLDVTLRDGGYRNNWNFAWNDALAIIELLADAGITYVEIGYRNSPPNESGVGLTGKTPDDFITAVRERCPTIKLAVMYAPTLIVEDDLVRLADLGVAMVRCTMPHRNPEPAFPLMRRAHELGMISTANITNVTQYDRASLLNLSKRIVETGCDVLYLADSNGSMTPESTRSLFTLIREHTPSIHLGFHNHNMLGMGMACAIEAIGMGALYVDCSLRGMGRSAGNVPTEALLTYLSAVKGQAAGYSVQGAIRAALHLQACEATADPQPTLADMAYGAYDFDSLLGPLIMRVANDYGYVWYELIAAMAEARLDKSHITAESIREAALRAGLRQQEARAS